MHRILCNLKLPVHMGEHLTITYILMSFSSNGGIIGHFFLGFVQ